MEKIWYIKIYGNREGPYSILDLKNDRRINPDTLVWRQGFDSWQPIRFVPELQIVFKDDEQFIENGYEAKPVASDDDELVLEMRGNNQNKWLWAALAAAIIIYIWLKLWI